MKALRIIAARLRGLFLRRAVEREMDEELRLHIELRARENMLRGMAEGDARRAAVRSFGSLARVKEACRDVKGGGFVETLIQDVRYGARMLRKNLAFTLVAVMTLALGVGANTAIFSVVNAVLFRPLPYPEAGRLVRAHWRWQRGEIPSVTATEFAFWREHGRSFEEAAGVAGGGAGFNLTGGTEPQRVNGLRVTGGFFRVLGVQPALGRGFTAEEERPQGPCAAVFTDALWRNWFGGDAAIVGRPVQLNGLPCTVVGVMPAGFQYQEPADLLVSAQLRIDPRDQGHNTDMIARLRPGVSLEQAQAEMDALLPRFAEAHPKHLTQGERGIRLVPFRESIVDDVSWTLLILLGAVAFVLLIACANVANLLLARAASRGGEMAVRVALGAGRGRLVRQLMTENLLLSLLGGAAGLLLAAWGVDALVALSPAGLPRAAEIRLDAHAMLFAALAACATSVIFGVAPALSATRIDLIRSLKGSAGRSGAGGGGRRVRSLLVVSEVALSLVLLVGAGLLIVSFGKLRLVSLGFDPQNLHAIQVSLNSAKYATTAQTWEFQRRVAERIAALPGVEAVATVPSLPLERGLNQNPSVQGREGRQSLSVESRAISPGYFRAMGIPLHRGRAFSEADAAGSPPVMIVNEAFARRFWREEEPVGQFVRLEDKDWQVVGVAADIKEMGLARPVKETFYVPAPQLSDGMTRSLNRGFLTSWLVRTSGPLDLNAQLRAAIREADPELPVARVRPMTEVVSSSVSPQRFVTTLMSAFAALALALTAVGLYGVLSYQVSQRTQEIGIRMALGAQRGDVMRLVVGQGLRLTLVGVGLGLAGALALTRLMKGLLFGVTASDPLTYAAISLLLVAVSLAACFIPARRATRVDPTVALRYE